MYTRHIKHGLLDTGKGIAMTHENASILFEKIYSNN